MPDGGQRAPLPRLVRASKIRALLGGISGGQLLRLRRAGIVPDPLPGTRLYDYDAVRQALDRRRNPEATIASVEDELIERARQWGKSA